MIRRLLALLLVATLQIWSPPPAAPAIYRVACGAALPTFATRSLAPGDSLLFERGCTWTGNFVAAWNGTASAPINLGAYGTGARPIIQINAANSPVGRKAISLTGSYLSLSGLATGVINTYRHPGCLLADGRGVRFGFHIGFNVSGGHDRLTDIEVIGGAIGINLVDVSHDTLVSGAYVHGLDTLWNIEPPTNALGVIGVNIHGTNQEVALSKFEDNFVACVRQSDLSLQSYGAPFELYNSVRAYIHHNSAYEHRKTAEVGRDPGAASYGNRFEYNLIVSARINGRGPNLHGADAFGPITTTTLSHNTLIFTGAGSQALICGCVGGASVTDNIFAAEWKAAYYNGGTAARNVYWDYQVSPDASSDPYVQGITVGVEWLVNPLLDSAYRSTLASRYPLAGALPYLPPGATATPSRTATATASQPPTATPSRTATATRPPASPTVTPSHTATETASASPTATKSPTPTDTPTETLTPTPTSQVFTGCTVTVDWTGRVTYLCP